MKPVDPNQRRRMAQPIVQILNMVAIGLSIAITVGLLLGLLLKAFTEGGDAGIRSLAATALPLIAIAYIAFFTELFRPPDRTPSFNIYVLFTIWTIIVLTLISAFPNPSIPVGEFLLSITLGLLASMFRQESLQLFLSCTYGILSGFLVYVLLRGIPIISD